MKFLADPNIPCVEEVFSSLGDVRLLPGREWNCQQIKDADCLLVRSVTPVNESLLAGSAVQFVGTATSGTDHIDVDYLNSRNICFVDALGANAQSVAEYVISSLLILNRRHDLDLVNLTVGIIGYGQVGSRLVDMLEKLGITCLVNDPLLETQACERHFVSLEESLTADVISLHVPLTMNGDYPTFNLINAEVLQALPTDTIIINSARGGIVDETALLNAIQQNTLRAVIDCWSGEPQINVALANSSVLATAHIAGYSADGKLRGTEMLYRRVCEYLHEQPEWHLQDILPVLTDCDVSGCQSWDECLTSAVLGCYDMSIDDGALRVTLRTQNEAQRFSDFDALRRDYPQRREFSALKITGCQHAEWATRLQAIGMQVS